MSDALKAVRKVIGNSPGMLESPNILHLVLAVGGGVVVAVRMHHAPPVDL